MYSLILHILHHSIISHLFFPFVGYPCNRQMYFGMAFSPSSRHPTKKPYFFPRSTIGGNRPSQPLLAGVFPFILRDSWVIRKQWSAAKIITEIQFPFPVYQNISSCPSIPIKSDHKFYVLPSKFPPTLILFVYSIVHAPMEFEFSGCWAQYSKSSHKWPTLHQPNTVLIECSVLPSVPILYS